MDQSTVENITEQLLKRSEDAIWQLECWIRKQEDQINKYNNDTEFKDCTAHNDSMVYAKERQQLYYKQLKSLQRRSLYLKHCIHAGLKYNIDTNTPHCSQQQSYTFEGIDTSSTNHNNNNNIITNNDDNNFAKEKKKKKKKKNRHSVNIIQDDISYMENLIYEFKDLTLKLNELAQTKKNTTFYPSYKRSSPSSLSSDSSSSSSFADSLELKPLRILSRRNIRSNTSNKNENNKSNNIHIMSSSPSPSSIVDNFIDSTPKKQQLIVSSLPNSPIHSNVGNVQLLSNMETPKKKLRLAKSYYNIPNNKSKLKEDTDKQMNNFFKKNNRLSLAVFQNMKIVQETNKNNNSKYDDTYSDNELDHLKDTGDVYGADDNDDELDQDTLLLSYDMSYNRYLKTPILASQIDKFPRLQRSNSHDSIFSKKITKKPLRFYQFYTNNTSSFLTNGTRSRYEPIKTTLDNTVVVTQPTFIKTSSKSNETSSKVLLSNIINSEQSVSTKNQTRPLVSNTSANSNSIFSNWNLFGRQSK